MCAIVTKLKGGIVLLYYELKKDAILPAIQAVVKQEMLASVRRRNIIDAISFVLDGQTAFQTPTATARVEILLNPARA